MNIRLLLIIIGVWGMAAGATAVTLSSVINNGFGGTFDLTAGQTYTGETIISNTTTINGNGATLQQVGAESIRVGAGATLTIRNMTITGGAGVNVTSSPSDYGRLVGEFLTITGSSESGVVANKGTVDLLGCVITGGVYGVYCYNGAVLENLTGCVITGQSDTGIFLNASPGLNIRNTRVANCLQNGILALNSPRVTIANCVFENIKNATKAHSFSIQNSQNVFIGEGTIVRHNDKGLFLFNCPNAVIRDTTVLDCFYLDGISLQGGTTATIDNCDVSLCQAGIAIVDGSGATVTNSFLHNNKKKQTSPILGQGIFILAASSAIVQNCTITGNDNEGIYIQNSQFLILEDSVLMDNGFVAQDGNGVFCDNTPGFIFNNKIIHNYLKGIQSRTQPMVIEGNEIRLNGRGGITILGAAGSGVDINENLVHGNGSLGGSDEELNVTGSGAVTDAANNLFSNSNREGVLAQSGAYINLRGNVIRNNAIFGVNLFNGNARLEDNVVFGSQRNIYHNGANVSEGYFNDIFGASASGAEAINCSGCPLRYQNNWWGHPTGPNAASNPGGQGVFVNNVLFSPWQGAPLSAYAVFENISAAAGVWSSWQAATMPWAKFSVRPESALSGQYVAGQASRRDLFVRVPKTFGVPADTIYLWVVGSFEIRHTPLEAMIELTNPDGTFPSLASAAGYKFDKVGNKWRRLTGIFIPGTQTMQLHVEDLQGLYLLSPSGTLVTGEEEFTSQFYVY